MQWYLGVGPLEDEYLNKGDPRENSCAWPCVVTVQREPPDTKSVGIISWYFPACRTGRKINSVACWLRSPYFCYSSLAGSTQVISLILFKSFVKCLIKPLAPPTPTLFLAFIFFSFFFICLKFTDMLHSRFNCIVTYKCKIHVLWLFSFGDQFLIFYGVALFKKFFWFT